MKKQKVEFNRKYYLIGRLAGALEILNSDYYLSILKTLEREYDHQTCLDMRKDTEIIIECVGDLYKELDRMRNAFIQNRRNKTL